MKINNLLVLFSAVLLLASCSKTTTPNNPTADAATTQSGLVGAGATFPYPLYSKMFDVYHQENKTKVNYQSIGSGAGIQQLQNMTVDFGASDAPMNDEELNKSSAEIVHIPTCLGAVVITYNLPGITSLKFTPAILTDIFLGKIKTWNDAAIARTNPGIQLPSLPISVVHRSDGSGTTFIFSDYLSKVSKDWQDKVGKGKSLNWPAGLGAKGNEGVSGFVKQTPGSIGYVELSYAFQNKMSMAALQNQAGNFIVPSLESTSAAANITDIPNDLRVSITNSPASNGYPICSFSYILLYKDQFYKNRTEQQAMETVNLVSWMIHQGQAYNEPLEYGKLPESIVTKAQQTLSTVTYKNKALLK